MFSTLSYHWNLIQETLFPSLKEKEDLSETTEMHRRLIILVELIRPEEFIPTYRGYVGHPEKDRCAIARAFIAKHLYNISTTKHLIDRLICDPVLRRICGWESKRSIPSESTFSRAFAEFSESDLPGRMHEAFIKEHHQDRIIGHISRDSTSIEAREKVKKIEEEKTEEEKTQKKRGRPKKGEERELQPLTRLERQVNMSLPEMLADLPQECDIGTKKNSKGFKITWKGYKLHIDTADGDIPISAILTSASPHDSQVSIPLSRTTVRRVVYLYELMDAAYDAEIIRSDSIANDHVPLIDFNKRSPNDEREFLPHEKERYKNRSSSERVNSLLKDNHGGSTVRVKGSKKVKTHLMFGLLVIAVEQTLRLLT